MPVSPIPGVTILAPVDKDGYASILTPDALSFLAKLQRAFNPTRLALLRRRQKVEREINSGVMPNFLESTRAVREDPSWRGAQPAPGLVDRRVEITGPVDRKMVINALNSGATQFMADFEDSNAPTWENNMNGQVNLRDANLRAITYQAPAAQGGKTYKLREDGKIATLLVRPRGWHLDEKHVIIDNAPCSGSIFDFALYFYHNAKRTVELGFGPYFYLPKMESHLEARLWNDIFNMAQDLLGLPRGTIRATVLIETILASFEMEEIIYELRDHSAGLNCGRWDYIFSVIKKFRNFPEFITPERPSVSMTVPFMDAYVRLLIQTCHKRGVHAMGGMAAQIPIRDDPKANDAAMAKVRADKLREVKAGHDGTWVAHPALVPIAREIFDAHMPWPNQLHIRREDVRVLPSDLLNVAGVEGQVTERSIRANIYVGLRYMESWLRGLGCVPLENLMEDAATAEISRSQLWQWVRHGVRTSDTGRIVTRELVAAILDEELSVARKELGAAAYERDSKFDAAARLFLSTVSGEYYSDFLTSLCYDEILTPEATAFLKSSFRPTSKLDDEGDEMIDAIEARIEPRRAGEDAAIVPN